MQYYPDSVSELSLVFLFLSFLFLVTLRWSRGSPSLKDIKGPVSTSFWLGNIGDIRYQDEVGDVEFSWMREFGGAWKFHGCMGEEHLMVADPKAIQYMLQTSAYRFPKRPELTVSTRLTLGEGIVWADGDTHKRHRKVMSPAFAGNRIKALFPVFQRIANRLQHKWRKEVIASDPSGQPVINVHKWLSRTTLDIIGETGFGFEFGALDSLDNALNKVYSNLFVDSTLYPRPLDVLFRSLWRYAPMRVLNLVRYLPGREYTRFRHYFDFIQNFSRGLVSDLRKRGGSQDIMSSVLEANEGAGPQAKLSENEIIDQISTLLLAGHDTTASSLTWWLWELAKNPDSQSRARKEVKDVLAKAIARGDTDFALSDIEDMHYLQATVKEAMRLHPIAWSLGRQAGQDDVIPLSFPILSKTGQTISGIPVKKGQVIDVSVAAYNRHPGVWGADADVWNPERFLEIDPSTQITLGVYWNMMNFSSGVRACLGWRFAVIELQTIAATLITNFEFSLPPPSKDTAIKRKPMTIMAPMADGYPGVWLGLKVKAL